jgi:hypothetical protein
MADTIYRGFVSYSGVLHDEHNESYLKIVEEAIADFGGSLKLSWDYRYDLEEYEPEEIEESIARDPFYLKTLRAEGEPSELLVFMDDQCAVNLKGASEEWILLVNAILHRLEAYNVRTFGMEVELADYNPR